jgi:hypothetical protein
MRRETQMTLTELDIIHRSGIKLHALFLNSNHDMLNYTNRNYNRNLEQLNRHW